MTPPIIQSWIARLQRSSYPSIRVGQLDADLLDNELFDILISQVRDSSQFIKSQIKDHYSSEFNLLLKALIWKVTVWDNSATYGGLLQNIRIVDASHGLLRKGALRSPSNAQKIALGILTVFGDYSIQRINDYVERHDWNSDRVRWKKALYALFQKAGTAYSIVDLANFLVFLYNGKYPSLMFRVCRLRLMSSSRSLSRQVSFEFLNRQLVWNEFTNFLLFVLPIIHLPKLKKRFNKLVSSTPIKPSETTGQLAFLPERTCAICYHQDSRISNGPGPNTLSIGMQNNDITNPYAAVECGHVYCYVCLVTQIEEQEGEGWSCLRCGQLVKHARPWIDKQGQNESSTSNIAKNLPNALDEEKNGPERETEDESDNDDDDDYDQSDDKSSTGPSEDWSRINFETDTNSTSILE